MAGYECIIIILFIINFLLAVCSNYAFDDDDDET